MKKTIVIGDLGPAERLELARGTKAAPVGEREAFEAHMRVGGYSNPDKHPDGSYVSSAMELWWQGWKACAAHQRQQAREVVMPSPDDMADAFISWPLPKSVHVDPCASDPEYPHRYGTNLLTWAEAKAMFEYVLASLNKGAGSHE